MPAASKLALLTLRGDPMYSMSFRNFPAAMSMFAPPHGLCPSTSFSAGFSDPFDPVETITLDNKDYRIWGISLMEGKLDWLLLRRCRVESKDAGNHDYAASDHKWLSADVHLV